MYEKKNCRILAIGAHPDDIEIGCGGTLINAKENGGFIATIVLSGLSDEIRRNEQQQAGERLGVISTWHFDDEDTAIDLRKCISNIEIAIGTLKPTLILTHSAADVHQDHQVVAHATDIACRRKRISVFAYEGPSTRDFSPDVFIEIGSEFEEKAELVACHRSQNCTDKLVTPLIATARFRGSQSYCEYAEGFETQRIYL